LELEEELISNYKQKEEGLAKQQGKDAEEINQGIHLEL